jgi:hypothetical protein
MIHYHGLPITPESCAAKVATGGHVFLSFAHAGQQGVAVGVAQSFAVDNGAYSAWRAGRPVADWGPFWEWAQEMTSMPSCDFVVLPDVIDGSEADNDDLIAEAQNRLPEWSLAPVWHLHESIGRLESLANEFSRVCLGSSGAYAEIGTTGWWRRIGEAMAAVCDDGGRPMTKLHGLRMLDINVFTKIPFASADSTNIGRNIGIDSRWSGAYSPATKETRAMLIRERIEAHNAPHVWRFSADTQPELFAILAPGGGEPNPSEFPNSSPTERTEK